MTSPDKILVIRHRFIGDTLLAQPMLRALRQAKPKAHLTILTAPDSVPLLRYGGFVDERLVFGVKQSSDGTPLANFWVALQHLRTEHYDVALILKRSFSSAAMAWLAGIPVRVGFNTENRGFLLTKKVPYRPELHEADCFMEVLGAYLNQAPDTLVSRPLKTECVCVLEDTLALDRLWPEPFSAKVRHLAVHVSASNPGKQWPLSYFGQLVEQWLSASPANQIHLLGTSQERQHVDALITTMDPRFISRIHNWTGQLPLRSTAVLLRRMHHFVGADSGLAHLAAAVGTPVTVCFGPTSDIKWKPIGQNVTVLKTDEVLACQPCHLKIACPIEHRCLSGISPERVFHSIETAL